MPQTTRGYAAHSPTSALGLFHFVRRDPRDNDVVIDILYSGVCHSDLHTARNDWGGTVYPTIPGHEIVGRVVAVGSSVTQFKVGDAVGVGCLVDSCQSCGACAKGWEQYCENGMTGTYNSTDRVDGSATQGGYSERIVVRQEFVLKVPESMDLKGAAPLLCAGITTWSPLRHWNVGAGSNVAVVGLGGLGHMALKLAKALGAHVTLFSRSTGKEEDAKRLGADRVVISTDRAQMKAVSGQFDLIIDTVPYAHDLNAYTSHAGHWRYAGAGGLSGPARTGYQHGHSSAGAQSHCRLCDWRDCRDTGDAEFLWSAWHYRRCRDDCHARHQRSL